jgi:hypothetical protein
VVLIAGYLIVVSQNLSCAAFLFPKKHPQLFQRFFYYPSSSYSYVLAFFQSASDTLSRPRSTLNRWYESLPPYWFSRFAATFFDVVAMLFKAFRMETLESLIVTTSPSPVPMLSNCSLLRSDPLPGQLGLDKNCCNRKRHQ